MNSPLTEAIECVVEAIESASYCSATKQAYRKEFQQIAEDLSAVDLGVDEALGLIDKGKSLRRRCCYLVRIAWQTGQIDLTKTIGRRQVKPESENYQQTYADYIVYLKERGHAESSIRVEGCLARKYLVFLESNKCFALTDINPASIFSFVASLESGWQVTSIGSALSLFRPFVRYLGRDVFVNLKRVH